MRADPDLPALTEAEARFVDSYLAVVDQLARLNPAHAGDHAYRLVRASQDIVAAAEVLRSAAEDMWQRGEREVFGPTLLQTMLALDGDRRTRRLLLPAPAADGDGDR